MCSTYSSVLVSTNSMFKFFYQNFYQTAMLPFYTRKKPEWRAGLSTLKSTYDLRRMRSAIFRYDICDSYLVYKIKDPPRVEHRDKGVTERTEKNNMIKNKKPTK